MKEKEKLTHRILRLVHSIKWKHIAFILLVITMLNVTALILYIKGGFRYPGVAGSIYIDGKPWGNGTLLDWSSSLQKELDVRNAGNTTTYCCLVAALPANWNLTWSIGGTNLNETWFSPGSWKNGTLALDRRVPVEYSWTIYVMVG